MIKNYLSYIKETAAKWYSGNDDLESEDKKKNNDYDYDDDYDHDDYDNGDDGDDDHDYDDDSIDFENQLNNMRYKHVRGKEYNVGDEICYLGNTGGHRYQDCKIERIRPDGKYVVRFPDRKLIAVSKDHVGDKMNDDEFELLKLGKIKEREEKIKAMEIERLAREEELKNQPAPTNGGKWWEKNKK